jgi:hypothetical protein
MARKATGQVIERDGRRGRTYALRFPAYGRYTKSQIGHLDARFTMGVYTHVGNRREAANARLDALIAGPEKAQTGTNPVSAEIGHQGEPEAEKPLSAQERELR